jgi:hypothetical protein
MYTDERLVYYGFMCLVVLHLIPLLVASTHRYVHPHVHMHSNVHSQFEPDIYDLCAFNNSLAMSAFEDASRYEGELPEALNLDTYVRAGH